MCSGGVQLLEQIMTQIKQKNIEEGCKAPIGISDGDRNRPR